MDERPLDAMTGLMARLSAHPFLQARGDGLHPKLLEAMGQRPLIAGPPTIAAEPEPSLPSAEVIALPLAQPKLWKEAPKPSECGTILLFTGVRRERVA